MVGGSWVCIERHPDIPKPSIWVHMSPMTSYILSMPVEDIVIVAPTCASATTLLAMVTM